MKKLGRYIRVFWGRIYRPRVKRLINPLLRRVRLVHVLGVLVGLGLLGRFWSVSPIYQAQEKAAWWPWSTKAHAEMALQYFENGEETKAKEELEQANSLLLVSFKAAKEKLRMAESKVQETDKIREEIRSWEKILEERPYYRDVLLRLAVLNYQVYNDDQARDYWQQANYLDPNNKEVEQVGKVISASF